MRFIVLAVAVVAVMLVFLGGLRLTTADEQDKAESDHMALIQEREEADRWRKAAKDKDKRIDALLDYLEDQTPPGDSTQDDGGFITIPGQPQRSSPIVIDDNDDGGKVQRKTIRRNTTVVPSPSSSQPESNDDEPPVVPKVPIIEDVQKQGGDILKDTPLGGLL